MYEMMENCMMSSCALLTMHDVIMCSLVHDNNAWVHAMMHVDIKVDIVEEWHIHMKYT